MARMHLRLGSLALARTELEIGAGLGALDVPGYVDLAEVRWRTGDLSGAGEAALVAIAAGEEAPVALAIAAEAASALGRPNEARRLATMAIERAAAPIDDLFAGMPRSAVWPADAAEPPPTAGTLFHHDPAPPGSRRAGDKDPSVAALRAHALDDGRAGSGAEQPPGFWDAEDGSGPGPARSTTHLPDPARELEAGRAALFAGSGEEAALRFGLALRLAPALAPAVLEATDGMSGATVNLVRGDAYRLVGLESEAQRAYAAAAWSGARDRRSGDPIGETTGPSPDGSDGAAAPGRPRPADGARRAVGPDV
jgi:hypothetical protein